MLKSYNDLRKIDVSKYTDKRDGAEYLNWAKCIDLLHENGAEQVYFIPMTNANGSSLFMSDVIFETGTKDKKINRCYETRIEIHIDDKVYYMQSPVMNGANPVQDNSMTQQRVWNSMCRSFVKGVAIYTGLGFDLWLKEEDKLSKQLSEEDDLSKHDIYKIKERFEVLLTQKNKEGITIPDIARNLGISEEELKTYFTYFKTLDRLEKRIQEMKAND